MMIRATQQYRDRIECFIVGAGTMNDLIKECRDLGPANSWVGTEVVAKVTKLMGVPVIPASSDAHSHPDVIEMHCRDYDGMPTIHRLRS